MKKLTQNQISSVLIALIVVIGLFLFRVPQKVWQQIKMTQTKQAQTQNAVLSIAGSVGSVDANSHSFKLIAGKEQKEAAIQVGANTKLVRLVFPLDSKNPPANKTFTPKLEPAAFKDLKKGSQVFVRSAKPIKAGQDVINAIEIQILP